jgi:hypothetical protein
VSEALTVPEDDDVQPEDMLFSVPRQDAYAAGSYHHTALRLRTRDRAKYEAIKGALEAGTPITHLAKAYHVSVNTVYAVIQDMGGMDKLKESLKDKLMLGAHLATEVAIELLPSCKKPMEAAMVAGILMDKHAMASGAPTLVIEHRTTQHTEAVELFKQMAAAVQAKAEAARLAQGQVVEMQATISTIHQEEKIPA